MPGGGVTRARRLTTFDDVLGALRRAARAFPGGDRGTSRLVPDSLAFGYALRGTDLVPVARAKLELAKGRYKMFEAIEADLVA